MNIKDLSEKIDRVSQHYAQKYGITRDSEWFVLKLEEEIGELVQNYLMLTNRARTKGKTEKEIKDNFEKEVADVFCHILLLSKHYSIDLENVIEKKWLEWIK